ncbi:MAG: hypothetical protein FWD48_00655 [Oscillospiraceae bacterium]|nr:hypothetical protein [Oscillospiraceae bacterium]
MKKPISFLLCLFIIISATACDYWGEIVHEVNRELAAAANLELISDIERNAEQSEQKENDENEEKEASEEPRQERIREASPLPAPELDTSSPEAFAESVWEHYSIILQDRDDLFNTDEGLDYMQEIEHALMLFSPAFMRALADIFHKEHRATYIIRVDGHNDDQYGIAVWNSNIIVTVYSDNDPALCGITAPVLAHEIGHTIHYLIEEYISEEQSERDMEAFNGEFEYVGDRYDRVWREKLHGTTFAYDYGMSSYYEDIATIFELLVEDPADMTKRLSDTYSEPLLLKTQYIREMTYKYVSDECYLIFMPLYEAEEILELGAAA